MFLIRTVQTVLETLCLWCGVIFIYFITGVSRSSSCKKRFSRYKAKYDQTVGPWMFQVHFSSLLIPKNIITVHFGIKSGHSSSGIILPHGQVVTSHPAELTLISVWTPREVTANMLVLTGSQGQLRIGG